MKISKHALKEIALTAQYRPGDFFEPGPKASWASAVANTHPGTNCIVGAIVRAYVSPDTTVSGAYALAERLTHGVGCAFSPRSVAKKGNYLGSLSAHFENIMATFDDGLVDDTVRQELASFIDENFPAHIELALEVAV